MESFKEANNLTIFVKCFNDAVPAREKKMLKGFELDRYLPHQRKKDNE